MKKIYKKIFLSIAAVAVCGLIVFGVVNFYVAQKAGGLIFDEMDQAPSVQTALVLGAKVYAGGRMSDMFHDRVETARLLYQGGKVKKILVSGDHGQTDYDEVNAAKKYLLENGVAEQDIFLDHAGFDTYDSLYRARDIFGVGSVIAVTQNFHLPRTVYIGRSLGLEVYGFSADLQPYRNMFKNQSREKLAVIKAWLNVLFKAKPKFLGEKIDINGDGRVSWD